MLGLSNKDIGLLILVTVLTLATPILLQPFPEGSGWAQFNAGYPDLMQRFAIYGIFAIGFNILFGLTGYLSFGHAAFLGVGSYSVVWMYKLLDFNVLPGLVLAVVVSGILALVIGFFSLRRSGIYFSILTLAFAQMSYNVAYSVLTPLTNGETGLQVYSSDPQVLMGPNSPHSPHLFGLVMNESQKVNVGDWVFTFNNGYYFTRHHRDHRLLHLAAHLPLALRHRAPRHQVQPQTPQLCRHQHQALHAERICHLGHVCRARRWSARRDGPAGRRRAVAVDGVGRSRADDHSGRRGYADGAGPRRRVHQVFREHLLQDQRGHSARLVRLAAGTGRRISSSRSSSPFVGDGWQLTLGLVFVLVVVFLPGGMMEGGQRLWALGRSGKRGGPGNEAAAPQPAE